MDMGRSGGISLEEEMVDVKKTKIIVLVVVVDSFAIQK